MTPAASNPATVYLAHSGWLAMRSAPASLTTGCSVPMTSTLPTVLSTW